MKETRTPPGPPRLPHARWRYITEVFPSDCTRVSVCFSVHAQHSCTAARLAPKQSGVMAGGIMPSPDERWAEPSASSPICPSIMEQSERRDKDICCCITRISLFCPLTHFFLPSLLSALLLFLLCVPSVLPLSLFHPSLQTSLQEY